MPGIASSVSGAGDQREQQPVPAVAHRGGGLSAASELRGEALHDEHRAHRQAEDGERVERTGGHGGQRLLAERRDHDRVGEADHRLGRARQHDRPSQLE